MSSAFKKNTSIFLQIAERICDKILLEEFKEEEKIPSIREMAVKLEVNPNTVQRSYEWLTNNEIIYTKRGLGYFTSAEAKTKVMKIKQQQFIEDVLPEVFRNMQLLQIEMSQLENHYNTYLNKTSHEKK